MGTRIEVQDGKTDLVKIFVCHGAPGSVSGVEDVKTMAQVSQTRSPIARDLHLLFKGKSGFFGIGGSNWIQPVQLVRLASVNGVDAVGVELKPGQKWTPDLIRQAKGMFERRITPQTGATLPTTRKDFASASDRDIRAVMSATLPSEVFRDNPDPLKAIVPTINRREGRVDFKMTQECAKGLCGPMAVQATIARIGHAINAHYGVPAKRIG